MSETRTVHTAEEMDAMAIDAECTAARWMDRAAMLRQAAAQARVLAKLREQPTIKQQLDRLLREEGLR